MNLMLRQWLARLLRRHRRQKPRFRGLQLDRNPARLESNVVYIIGDDENVWAAMLSCPCGCKAVIHLSLAADSSPSWTVEIHKDGGVSLLPSVWRTAGCKSHFILYRGHVFWCGDSSWEEFA